MVPTDDITDVLIVGAGPAGLTVAIELARRGVDCRVVDRNAAAPGGTRCPTVWPRTLEIFAAMGLPVAGYTRHGVRLRRKVFVIGGDTATVELDDGGRTPLVVPQAHTEWLLEEQLITLGVRPERGVEATAVGAGAPGVEVEVAGPSGTRRLRAGWLVSAAGRDAHDPDAAQRSFPHTIWVRADVAVAAGHAPDPDCEYIFRNASGHAGLVPLPDCRHRLFLALSAGALKPLNGPADVLAQARRATGLPVEAIDPDSIWYHRPVSWLTAHHRTGRQLRVGEAAVRFPMPVYGLNNAVQDAFNLGWKLAAVVHGELPERLLDTYADERRSNAIALLARTERVLGYGSTASVEVLRERLRRGVFDVRTEPVTRYAEPLTVDRRSDATGGPQPGEPVGGDGQSQSSGWTILVTGVAPEATLKPATLRALREATARLPGVRLQTAPVDDGAVPALYLVRPDGHVGLRGCLDDIAAVRGYVEALEAE